MTALETRPPLGLRPKYIADAMRAREILQAIDRYLSAGKKVPAGWIKELGDLVGESSEKPRICCNLKRTGAACADCPFPFVPK